MENFFRLKERGTTVRTEVVAGITTFLAMSYILAVNPALLSQSGMDAGGVFTATALASAIATLVMAFVANLPVALAPGMGLNAFFTYTVVFGMGYSWQVALTAVFLEGILFIILSLLKVREAIIKAIPLNIKKAVAVGIGLFITLIGLANGGIVSSETGTIIGFVPLKENALVAVIGLIITIILFCCNVRGSIIIGMILTTIIGIPFGVTKIPENFSPISLPASPLFLQFDFSNVLSLKFFIVFFTFLFVDMFDTLGTLMGVAEQSNLKDKNGDIQNVNQALFADAIGTVAGAILGTSTVTSFVESTAGIADGGKTGLTSVSTAAMFLLALFLSPLFLIIPSCATAPALIIVGFLMMRAAKNIDFEDLSEGIPAFITIMSMPFAYSISTGITWGIISYVLCKIASKKIKDVSPVTWILFVVFLAKTVHDAL
ncbi:MAG: NCS2 family permease [Treponema sp.]|nr:NCS2 family permease [Treponema sp.]